MSYIKHGHTSRHGWSPTYVSWVAMRSRCDYPNHTSYHKYGGKGISYDPKWVSFEAFLADMGERPDGKTLDRFDSSKDYCKDNCYWATPTEQNLHLATRSDNTSGRKGVSWKRQIRRWIARGHLYGVEYLLYCGTSFEEACEAREAWELYQRPLLIERGCG